MTGMDRGARAWLVVVAADNYWRVAAWLELDDLIQEGHLVWAKIVKKYEVEPGRVRSRGHLMRLFRSAYINRIHDLAKIKTRNGVEVLAADFDECGVDAFPCSAVDLDRLVAEAPAMLKRLLLRLLSSDADGRALRSRYRVAADGTRETLNMRFCRLAGVNPASVDLVGALRAYLTEY